MDHVRLECVCRQENSLKFYEMDVAPDMLGSWVLECRWGRIDQDGSVSRNGYPDRDAAIAALRLRTLGGALDADRLRQFQEVLKQFAEAHRDQRAAGLQIANLVLLNLLLPLVTSVFGYLFGRGDRASD